MRWTQVLLVVLLATVWASCSSTKWVHPSKKEQQFTYDYNACEREIMNRQVTNSGTSSMHSNYSIEQERQAACLRQKGWREVKVKD